MNRAIWLYWGLIAFAIVGTAGTKFAGVASGPIPEIVSALIILTGGWVLVRHCNPGMTILVLALGATAEIVGIYTGYPFGRYAYSDVWQPIVHLPEGKNFPLLVPFAWFLIAGGCALLTGPIKKGGALYAAILATVIDAAMEPIIVNHLKYWKWLDNGPLPGGASILNPIGWFVTALLVAFLLHAKKEKLASKEAGHILGGYAALKTAILFLT